MRGLFVSIAVLFTILSEVPALADDHSIIVSGMASVSIPLDFATINLGVVSSSTSVEGALKDNNERMTRVVGAIHTLGVKGSEMRTSKFSVDAMHPRDRENGYDDTKTVGYFVSNKVKISVTDLTKVAKIIDAAIAAGANNLESVDFDIKNRSEIEDQALADAVKNARHRAEIMAAAEGAQIGQMIAMTNTQRSYAGGFETVTVTSSKLVETPILPGSIDLSAQVTVTYAIK